MKFKPGYQFVIRHAKGELEGTVGPDGKLSIVVKVTYEQPDDWDEVVDFITQRATSSARCRCKHLFPNRVITIPMNWKEGNLLNILSDLKRIIVDIGGKEADNDPS